MSNDLLKRLRARLAFGTMDGAHWLMTSTPDKDCQEAADRIETLEKIDSEAAEYVESVICMRTHFTGDPPYVGWKGLGLALNETLDRIEALETEMAHLRATLEVFKANPTPREQQLEAALREIKDVPSGREGESSWMAVIAERALEGKP